MCVFVKGRKIWLLKGEIYVEMSFNKDETSTLRSDINLEGLFCWQEDM